MHETTSPYLATASASAPRRWLGVGTLGLLGGLLLYVAFAAPPQNLAWLGFLIAMGLGAVFLAGVGCGVGAGAGHARVAAVHRRLAGSGRCRTRATVGAAGA